MLNKITPNYTTQHFAAECSLPNKVDRQEECEAMNNDQKCCTTCEHYPAYLKKQRPNPSVLIRHLFLSLVAFMHVRALQPTDGLCNAGGGKSTVKSCWWDLYLGTHYTFYKQSSMGKSNDKYVSRTLWVHMASLSLHTQCIR